MNIVDRITIKLVTATKGNPVDTVLLIFVFYVIFNLFEALLEKLIFGERFEHWGDVVFFIIFIAYCVYSVIWCASYNKVNKATKSRKKEKE